MATASVDEVVMRRMLADPYHVGPQSPTEDTASLSRSPWSSAAENATADSRDESMSSPPPTTPLLPSDSALTIAHPDDGITSTDKAHASKTRTKLARTTSSPVVARRKQPLQHNPTSSAHASSFSQFIQRQRSSRPLSPPSSHASSTPPTGSVDASESDLTVAQQTAKDPRTLTVSHGLHVLQQEALALAHITELYQSSLDAQAGLSRAVDAIVASQGGRCSKGPKCNFGMSKQNLDWSSGGRMRGRSKGKVILSGVGKSAHVAEKITATMKSLGIRASFMHATEAVHGDLGDVGDDDVLIIQSYSGKTPEILTLLPHIPTNIPIIAITSHTHHADVPLFRARASLVEKSQAAAISKSQAAALSTHQTTVPDPSPVSSRFSSTTTLNDLKDTYNLAKYNILLPATIHEPEMTSFGVNAPTSSTTVAMAVGDMLALSAAERLYGEQEGGVAAVFKRNHPGGAIGEELRSFVS